MRWTRFDAPITEGKAFAAQDHVVVLTDGEAADYVYEPQRKKWTRLPEQCAPQGEVQYTVATDDGLLVWTAELGEWKAKISRLVLE